MILTNLEKNSVEYANANKLLQDDKVCKLKKKFN